MCQGVADEMHAGTVEKSYPPSHDKPRALLAGIRPAVVHPEGHIQNLARGRCQPDLKRHPLALPGGGLLPHELPDPVCAVLPGGLAGEFDPADSDFKRHAGRFIQQRNERRVDGKGLAEKFLVGVLIEVVEQHGYRFVGIDARFPHQQDIARSNQTSVRYMNKLLNAKAILCPDGFG